MEKAAQLDPKFEETYQTYHRAYYDPEYPAEEAIAFLTARLEENPENSSALNSRAVRYAVLNKPMEALTDADRFLALAPQRGEYVVRLLIYCVQKDRDWARRENVYARIIEDLTRLIDKAPQETLPDLVILRGVMRWHAEDDIGAGEDFEAIIAAVPEAPMTHLRCVAVYRRLAEKTEDAAEKRRWTEKAEGHLRRAEQYNATDDGKLFELEVTVGAE